ncbi:unnamed protein product [Spodoptera littoralis]|uniref:Chitin-binding type-2 domain-containing protein n=1 Tax=Spodoptera littoralis TaxID=7109 RepID=A0A9P0I8L6_SPOLI|nr:unnamed protein product [Spodoptera littoralis]CAH1643059.1 unnamed protein product [Spodoptera littoralis]
MLVLKRCGNPLLVNCTSGSSTSDLAPITPADDPTRPKYPTLVSEELLPNGCPVNFFYNYRIPHETDCALHYHCQFGEKIKMQCADGLLYHYKHMNYDDLAQCDCTSGPAIDTPKTPIDSLATTKPPDSCPTGVWTNIRHPTLCNSFYYCNGNKSVQFFCVDGYEFDLARGCVEIAEGGCTFQFTTTTEATTSCVPIVEGGCTMSKATKPGGETTAQDVTTTAAPKTTTQDVTTTAAPKTTAQHVTTTAAPKTTAQDVTTTAAPKTTAQYVTTTTAPTTTTLAPTTSSHDIPNEGSKTEALDDTTTVAVDTTNEAPICAPGSCVPIAEGGCTLSKARTPAGEYTVQEVTTTTAPTTTTLSPTTTSHDIPDDGTTTGALNDTTTVAVDTTNDASICAPGEFGNVPHPDRCDAYYLCFAGNAYLFTCTEELEFDPETKSCMPIAEGGCTCTQSKPECAVKDKTTTVAPKTTEQEVITTTAAPTTTLAPTTASDDFPDDGTTTEAFDDTTTVAVDTTNDASICTPGEFGNVPHPDRCEAYYLCFAGNAFLFTCTEDLEFDPETKSCVPIAEGGCTCTLSKPECAVKDKTTTVATKTTEQEVRTTPAPMTTTLSPTTASDDFPDDGTTTEAFDDTTTVAVDTTNEGPFCAADKFGYIPHPDKCDVYYLCSAGKAILFT